MNFDSYNEFCLRNQPGLIIADLYTKEGRHLKRTISTEDGRIVDEEGPSPARDVVFLRPELQKQWGLVAHKFPPDNQLALPVGKDIDNART